LTTSESRPEQKPETVDREPKTRKKKSRITEQQQTVLSTQQITKTAEPVKRQLERDSVKNDINIARIVEAVLFAADRAMTVKQIQQVYPELKQSEIQKIQTFIDSIVTQSPEQKIKQKSNPEMVEQQPEIPPIEIDVNIKCIVEAILFAANRSMTVKQIQQVFPELEQPESKDIQAAIDSITDDYSVRPVELKKLASGYRFQVKAGLSPWIFRLFEEKPPRYSRALLETLAIIAYRQPVTRGEIEELRGVSVSSNIIRTLLDREWIRIIAHKEVPGRPALYGTTKQFLDYFNVSSLDELPALEEIKDIDLSGGPIEPIEQAGQSNSEKQETATREKSPESSTATEISSSENRTIH